MTLKYLIILSLSIFLLLNGCSNENDSNNSSKSHSDTTIISDGQNTDSGEKNNDGIHVTSPERNSVELEIYLYNNKLGCIPAKSLIPSDKIIDAELIINEVTANFDEKVIVRNIEQKEDYVAVYFDSESAPLIGISKKTEEAMLDCISYSLIDNLDDCNKIFFRTDKGNYSSDDISLDYDEPYLTR